jgi:hypothetical protein
VVAQIDHAVKVGGIDHVGIGTDFDGVGCVPAELSSYDKFPVLTRALLEKGYSAADIKKIYGGNLLRVMRAVEQRARELKSTPPIESKDQRVTSGLGYSRSVQVMIIPAPLRWNTTSGCLGLYIPPFAKVREGWGTRSLLVLKSLSLWMAMRQVVSSGTLITQDT